MSRNHPYDPHFQLSVRHLPTASCQLPPANCQMPTARNNFFATIFFVRQSFFARKLFFNRNFFTRKHKTGPEGPHRCSRRLEPSVGRLLFQLRLKKYIFSKIFMFCLNPPPFSHSAPVIYNIIYFYKTLKPYILHTPSKLGQNH